MSYESRGYNRSRHEGGGRYRRGSGGHHGGGGPRYRDDRRPYRRPYDREPSPQNDDVDDIEVRLKGLIVKIGDKISPELEVNLNKMKNILDNDYAKYPDTVQSTMKACISEIPAKAPVYGSLMGLLNVSNNDLVARLMTDFNNLMQETVSSCDWFKLKQLIRFYGELTNANVITSAAYCNLLNDLLAVLEEPHLLRRRADSAVYIVLSTLPWSGKTLSESNFEDLNQILKKIELYLQQRKESDAVDLLQQYHGDDSVSNQDSLAHIWELIQQLQNNGWNVDVLPKPYRWFRQEFEAATQHEIPRLELPAHSDTSIYCTPTRILNLLMDENKQSVGHLPDHMSLNYFILQDVIVDTLHIFESNRKECAKYLMGIPNSFEPGHFESSSSLQSADRMDEDEAGWSLPDLLFEVIIAQMLALPSAPYRQVFYSCILMELCRADTANFPRALGRGVKVMFERLPNMDAECVYRLWCWFSHHLSNFGFQWDWDAWKDALSLDPLHPQLCFIRETLEKEIRLSYYERIKSIIPEAFRSVIPSAAPAPDFKYKNPEDPLHQSAKTMIENMRAKKTVEEIRAILDKIKEDQASQGISEEEQNSAAREVFLHSLLLVGSKSFSHVLNVVERYLEVMRYVNSTPEARLHTVQVVASFWKNNTQFLGIILDKLLNYRVVDPTSVIAWVFEADQLTNAGRSYPWEILKNTLNKVVSRVVQVKSKLESFQNLHTANQARRAEEPTTEMAQAEAQQELDTLRIVENSLAIVTREEKEVFMVVYQKFVHVLQEMLVSYSAQSIDPNQNWTYWWVLGWYREVLRLYFKECTGFMTTLESIVFTPDIDHRITGVFQEIRSLSQTFSSTV
ncbi:armadillo-type protein [Radiomyces spectabilis]|uniref:armadillo-type protein n=1 Tax=Radiomyces spectabilis TaxID=64574 RepID=UPI00221F9C9C|nr:armadillo-type protein [Radiomyces spectabilis]KAI8381201.1 armadillo-type protein [Radiomyces spectabilis]